MIDPNYGNPADDYIGDDESGGQPHACYICHGHQVSPAFDGHVCQNCLAYWSAPIALAVEQDHLDWKHERFATIVVVIDNGTIVRTRFAEVIGDWVMLRHEGVDWYTRRDRIVATYVAK